MQIPIRQALIAVLIVVVASWSLAAAQPESTSVTDAYGRPELIASPAWLREHHTTATIVDVRTDEYFDGNLIDGAIRLPWSRFRQDDALAEVGSSFVGIERAAEILGEHGIGPASRVVLYDSVARDGGATASYVLWVLQLLGHEEVRILEGGIDAWITADGAVVKQARQAESVDYPVSVAALRPRILVDDAFIAERLDDPHYTIIDVRSSAEYRGEKGNKGLQDQPLKLGHIPGAYNIPYAAAWVDEEDKRLRDQAGLEQLYAGVDPQTTLIVYCASGRRGSFGYFTARLAGFERVALYEASWKEWGLPRQHRPVETAVRHLSGSATAIGGSSSSAEERTMGTSTGSDTADQGAATGAGDGSGGGYVSCGG